MAILSLAGVLIGYGGKPVLDGVDLTVEPGERIALVGRNGEGKSTLMKVISGEQTADRGTVWRDKGVSIARLTQEVPKDITGSVFDVAAAGLGEVGELVARYHHLVVEMATGASDRQLAQLTTLGDALETCDGWSANSRVESVLSRMNLDPETDFATLSGGMKRRVILARALAARPSLLLLDEPTNHLDIDAIIWLEKFLAGFDAALLFVTHDRAFLRGLANRVIELDRGHLTSWPGGYDHYLTGKASQLAAEEAANARFDKNLAKEEVWIRRGIKARRTRNEGRVRALETMREQRAQRRARQGTAKMAVDAGGRSGKLVIDVKKAGFAYPGGPSIIDPFTSSIMRGDRVGVVGPNGVGKSTLLNLLLGKLTPSQGTVRLGPTVQVAYFDQLRARLNDDETVFHAITEGGSEQLTVGDRTVHVMTYLRDFLFAPDRARVTVGKLSGGERNRLLLAKLFTRPANLLVLDEPTNDLDAETLDLLEEVLVDYSGTLLLVSHDRAFLNNVVTSCLAFDAPGVVNEYMGGYDDWVHQRPAPVDATAPKAPATAAPDPAPPVHGEANTRKRRLNYRERQELAALPAQIEALEAEFSALTTTLADPALYADAPRAAQTSTRLAEVEAEQEAVYSRWQALEDT